MRYVLLVSYDGTDFAGWQIQKSARTVQGTLEQAAAAAFGVPTKVTGSGRTDAGVHAMGQICHLDGESTIPPPRLLYRLNALLPSDVRVLKSAAAPTGFDCTRSAKRKTYVYSAYYCGESSLPLCDRYSARLERKPDLQRMRAAAKLIEGEHDFQAFCAVDSSAKTSVRTVYGIDVRETEKPYCTAYEIEVCGNGFLYNMVRIIAGELFAVGAGKGTDGICAAFSTGDRTRLARTMRPQGLTLKSVDYGFDLFDR